MRSSGLGTALISPVCVCEEMARGPPPIHTFGYRKERNEMCGLEYHSAALAHSVTMPGSGEGEDLTGRLQRRSKGEEGEAQRPSLLFAAAWF